MILTECRVIPAPGLSEEEVRALSKGWVVDISDRSLRIGDAFELVCDGESFWTMCRMDLLPMSLRRMSERELQYTKDHGHPLGGGKVRRVEVPYRKDEDTIVYIDIATCGLTLKEALAEIERLKAAHPDESIEMDDDTYSIVGRRRSA